jgi:hypothetical protein
VCTPCSYSSFADVYDDFPQEFSDGVGNAAHAADPPPPTDTADDADPVDTIDADLLELLANGSSANTNPEQDPSRSVEVQSPAPSQKPAEPQSLAPPPPTLSTRTQPNADASDPPQLVVDRFPHGTPGAPIPEMDQGSSAYQSSQEAFGTSIWAPFRSQCDWEIARWAKMRGPTSTALTDLLAIPEVRPPPPSCTLNVNCYCLADTFLKVTDKLSLSFSSAKELNVIIDKQLPGHPAFECRNLVIGGETLELYFRNILLCIWTIYSDPEFVRDLVVAPERHYTDQERTGRVYSEMHTGDWWWAVQVRHSVL